MIKHLHLEQIINRAMALGPASVAVTYPCSATAIEAAATAQRMGLIDPIMVGPRSRIEGIAEENKIDLTKMAFLETADAPVAAVRASVVLCQERRASVIMKGSLHTDEL